MGAMAGGEEPTAGIRVSDAERDAAVDLDRLLSRMDLNDIVQRIDVDTLVKQTDLGAVIAASSSGVAGDVLDVVRSQTVGLDEFIARWIGRLRRRPYTGPPGPPGRPQPGAAS